MPEPDKNVTIRGVPASVHRELSTRAARRGQSLQEFLLAELTRVASKPGMVDLLDEIRSRKESTGTRLPAERILTHRDAERA